MGYDSSDVRHMGAREPVHVRRIERVTMTPKELYDLLDKAGVEYEVVEIFEGSRWLRIDIDEETDNESEISGG